MQSGHLLEVDDLRTYLFTRRGVVKAVDGVSFSLDYRETLGLVGESGSGKSMTCLSILRAVPQPAGKIVSGRVVFNGEDLLKKSNAEMRRVRGKQISVILQDPLTSLNPAYTIGDQLGETIALHQRLRGESLRGSVVNALRLVKIPAAAERLNAYPHQMSGGMRQRVVGAMAISCQPKLLIADEPTTALDVTIQAQFLDVLSELQQNSGAAMLFITHDLSVVARMCHRVAVMYAGRIVEMCETEELFDHPRHPYTKALLCCLPRVDSDDARLCHIEGEPPDPCSLPPGCPFAPRCAEKNGVCDRGYPPKVEIKEGHFACCWMVK